MISILDKNFSALNQYIIEQNPSQIFILVDENTHENCLPTLLANLDTEIPFEIIEIEDHPFFIGVQYHPEYKSTVANPHPIFVNFVAAAVQSKKNNIK